MKSKNSSFMTSPISALPHLSHMCASNLHTIRRSLRITYTLMCVMHCCYAHAYVMRHSHAHAYVMRHSHAHACAMRHSYACMFFRAVRQPPRPASFVINIMKTCVSRHPLTLKTQHLHENRRQRQKKSV